MATMPGRSGAVRGTTGKPRVITGATAVRMRVGQSVIATHASEIGTSIICSHAT